MKKQLISQQAQPSDFGHITKIMVFNKIRPLIIVRQLKSAVNGTPLILNYSASAVAGSTSSAPTTVNFVPEHTPSTADDVERLQEFLQKHSRLFVITGMNFALDQIRHG
jgi:hypothetical protein